MARFGNDFAGSPAGNRVFVVKRLPVNAWWDCLTIWRNGQRREIVWIGRRPLYPQRNGQVKTLFCDNASLSDQTEFAVELDWCWQCFHSRFTGWRRDWW